MPAPSRGRRYAAVSWHAGPVVDIGVGTVLDLIDRVVAAQPDDLAVREPGRSATYAELGRLADVVADRLTRHLGIGRGDVVMIAAEAGVAFTAAVLGTLRAGAAYLPVDTSYPRHRLQVIYRASRAGLLVQGNRHDESLQDGGAGRRIALDDLVADGQTGAPTADRSAPAPGDAAYVIFSSGSSGAPKGIVQTHRCLANFTSWQVAASGLGRARRVLQAAPLSFDVSVQEIFSTLAGGGCLCVPDADVRRDPRELVDFIVAERIEVVDFPQSLLDAVMRLPKNLAQAPDLRHIISAGETVRVTTELRALLTARPELVMHNHYGPAENHMLASCSMSREAGNIEEQPPVGALVWNTYIRIMDDEGRDVPDGQVGEIYIGGAGLALGYTDPALDATAFVSDPADPAARLYRTRDRGLWRADGMLKLLGRVDDLIKIRGNGVEPREVEAAFAAIPGVRDVAAFAVRRGDNVELHAALTGSPPPARELRRQLLSLLPAYMVPFGWWLVPELPVSPNGKLDRRGRRHPGCALRPGRHPGHRRPRPARPRPNRRRRVSGSPVAARPAAATPPPAGS